MKRSRPSRFIMSLAVGILAVFVAVLLAETLVVKVKSTNLRKEPVFYSSTVAVLQAGESVEKLAEKSGWFQVKTKKGITGWVHSSALRSTKIGLSALTGSVQSGAKADEVALASKGFNKQVEDQFKAKNSDISFVWVDRMLKLKVDPAQLRAFLQKGKLGEFGGSQ